VAGRLTGMRHPEGPRFIRRLRKRREAAARADPGVKFGAADPRSGGDRRQAERRDTSLTPEQVEARMKALGISTDRRHGDRRGGDRRR
jgi:hypothetical protein